MEQASSVSSSSSSSSSLLLLVVVVTAAILVAALALLLTLDTRRQMLRLHLAIPADNCRSQRRRREENRLPRDGIDGARGEQGEPGPIGIGLKGETGAPGEGYSGILSAFRSTNSELVSVPTNAPTEQILVEQPLTIAAEDDEKVQLSLWLRVNGSITTNYRAVFRILLVNESSSTATILSAVTVDSPEATIVGDPIRVDCVSDHALSAVLTAGEYTVVADAKVETDGVGVYTFQVAEDGAALLGFLVYAESSSKSLGRRATRTTLLRTARHIARQGGTHDKRRHSGTIRNQGHPKTTTRKLPARIMRK